MICCLTELIGNVRVHSSAQQHVENLDAAADGQHAMAIVLFRHQHEQET